MATTMKDIARDLGVSVVTVSKVLRNHSDIGEQTRKRVLQRMKEDTVSSVVTIHEAPDILRAWSENPSQFSKIMVRLN